MIISDELWSVIKKHFHAAGGEEGWREGNPVRVFLCDGYECVQYQSGNWWHYDTEKGEWW